MLVIMKKIIVATGNQGKVKEIKEIFSDYEILSYKDLGVKIDVEEDADTFEGNALKKAKYGAEILGELCLADDSGIMIEYFDGWPGVRTARWMEGTDHERNLAIIEKMKGLSKEKRKVQFITAIAVADKTNSMVNTYTIDGYIAENPRGENGFGFDEIFELEDGRTLAELNSEEKNKISARKKALEKTKKNMIL
jgi:XTP/dITP diphosphohydrolase